MHDVLNQILEKTKADLEQRKKAVALGDLQKSVSKATTPSLFESAIAGPKKGDVAIIAEIKLASPTEPSLGSAIDIIPRARAYEEAGVDAISVVVEKHFFKGDILFVSQIKKAVSTPVFMKDFVIAPLQIEEAKKAGADALLLIAKIVSKTQLIDFVSCARTLGIEPVVEVNDEEDLTKALATNTRIIAVNARDLSTFTIDLQGACKLLQKIPQQFLKLGFSGVYSRVEVEQYQKAGAAGVLVGTHLMRAKNVAASLEKLISNRDNLAYRKFPRP